jgi:hypothetical protein
MSPMGKLPCMSPSETQATTAPNARFQCGRILYALARHPGAAMLHQVHSHPQLRLPRAQDTETYQCHHHGGQESAGVGLRAEQH